MIDERKGFTLIEMLIVLVIVAILSGLAIPTFLKSKKTALDKEAQVSLRLIQAAQKLYALRAGFYYPAVGGTTDAVEMNSILNLDLPSDNWSYGVDAGGVSNFTATAVRTGVPTLRITAQGDTY